MTGCGLHVTPRPRRAAGGTARPRAATRGCRSRRVSRRRGAVLVAALVCLLAVSLIAAALIRHALLHHRQLRLAHWDQQASLLVLSGISRAAAQLRLDAAYRGETWELSPDEFGGDHGGRVIIRVTVPDGAEQPPALTLEAIYPVEVSAPVRRQKSLNLVLPAQGDS